MENSYNNSIKDFLAAQDKKTKISVFTAAIGLIVFLTIGVVAPLRNLVFSLVYPKSVSHASVTISDTPVNTYGFNGWVHGVTATNDGAYVLGQPTRSGFISGGGVPLSLTDGSRLPNFPTVDYDVQDAISDGNGGWYIGGYFTRVGGADMPILAHINSDGTVDSKFHLTVDYNASYGSANINTLLLSGDGKTLYVGGWFGSINGQTRNNLAAFDTATGQLTSLNADINDSVTALALSPDNKTLYLGGQFWTVNGQSRNSAAALDTATSNLLSWNPNAYDAPHSLVVSSDGSTVYMAGLFYKVGGQTRNYLAAVDSTNGTLLSWNPVASASVLTMIPTADKTKVFVGGYFTSIGGQARNHLAELDLATGTVLPLTVDVDGAVDSLALSSDGNTLYLGGDFISAGGQSRLSLASADITGGTVNAWNPGAAGIGLTVALNSTNNALFAGGGSEMIGPTVYSQNRLAKIKKDGTFDINFRPDIPGAWTNTDALLLSHDYSTLYLRGTFSTVDSQPRNTMAAIDGTTGAIKPWNPNPDIEPGALTISPDDSTIYAIGNFKNIGGQPRNGIAALNTTDGSATSWAPNIVGTAGTLKLSLDGKVLYISGNFSYVNSQTRLYAAALDTSTGAVTSWDPHPTDASGGYALIYDVVNSPDNSVQYVIGNFKQLGGQPRNGFAAIDPATGAVTSFNPNITATPISFVLTPDGKTIYLSVYGTTSTSGTTSVYDILKIDVATGTVTPWNLNSDGAIGGMYLTPDGSTMFVNGNFWYQIGGQSRSRVAEIDIATGTVMPWNPSPDSTTDGFSFSPDWSTLYIGGCFTVVSGKPSPHLAEFSLTSSGLTVTSTPTNTPTPTLTPTPTPGIGGALTNTPTPTPTAIPTPLPTATSTPTPLPTNTPTPTPGSGGTIPTNTPTPTPTPIPTSTPSPSPAQPGAPSTGFKVDSLWQNFLNFFNSL